MASLSVATIAFTSVKAVSKVYLLAVAGFYLAKRGFLSVEVSRAVSKISFNMLQPALLFCNVTNVMTIANPTSFGLIAMVLVLQFGLSWIVSLIVLRLLRPPDQFRGSLKAAMVFGNNGDLVFALVSVACALPPFAPDGALAASGYVSIYVCIASALLFLVGDGWVASDYKPRPPPEADIVMQQLHEHDGMVTATSEDVLLPADEDVPAAVPLVVDTPPPKPWIERIKATGKLLLNPPNIAIAFGLLAGSVPAISNLLLPLDGTFHFIFDTVTMIGGAAVPMGLMLLGAGLARLTLKPALPVRIVSSVVVWRLLVMPVLSLLLVYLLAYVIRVPGMEDIVLQFVFAIQGVTPTGSTILMFEILHGGDGKYVSSLLLPQYIVGIFSIALTCLATLAMIEHFGVLP